MKICYILSLFLLWCFSAYAQQTDTVYVAEYGARPWTYENCTKQLREAIRVCKERRARVLAFECGRYDIWPEGAARQEYFISNTSSESECPSKIKTVGLLFEDMEDLTIAGNGATLIFHGKMTPIAFARCRSMRLCDLQIDFERPGGSEMTISKVDDTGVEVTVHRDTRYEIANGRMQLFGEGWRSNRNHCIEYDPSTERFFHSEGWDMLAASPAAELARGRVRFATPSGFRPRIGNTLTVRDIIRDQVGMFIFECEDMVLGNLRIYYMHGLGIVSQYTKNVTMSRVRCEPREGSGRLLASSADFMHFSGCSGKVTILECRFAGAQDDAINVHGTNLRAVEKVDEKTILLRFMHAQSYGYNAFFAGDSVAFVRASTMERYERGRVKAVRRISDRVVEVVFAGAVPGSLELGSDCVENLSRTPEVEIRRCRFTRTSTRGILVTTPRKVVIAENTFYKTGMSAILIEGDAASWYESGPVCDVLIRNNTFIECAYNRTPGGAVIAVNPSNTLVDADRPVHRNIRILGNSFETFGNAVLYAKSTCGLRVEANRLKSETTSPGRFVLLDGCKQVSVKNNEITSGNTSAKVEIANMKKPHVLSDLPIIPCDNNK